MMTTTRSSNTTTSLSFLTGVKTTAARRGRQTTLSIALVAAMIVFYSIASTVLITYSGRLSLVVVKEEEQAAVLPTVFLPPLAPLDHQGQQHHHHHHDGRQTTTSSSFSTSPTDTSACLLVMDDNHFLVEWLAYHYHTFNLKNLIIAVDPKSYTSPSRILERWRGKMTIQQWHHDGDYMTLDEFQKAQVNVERYFSYTTPALIRHRARQRLFYTKCLQAFQRAHVHWTMLLDSDEYLTINPATAMTTTTTTTGAAAAAAAADRNNETRTVVGRPVVPPRSLDRPGSIVQFLHENTKGTTTTRREEGTVGVKDNAPLFVLQSSPCVQIPRIRYVVDENDKNDKNENDDDNDDVGGGGGGESESQKNQTTTTDTLTATSSSSSSFHPDHLMTLQYKTHSVPTDLRSNKISKVIVDLSRIPPEELKDKPVDSIHVPFRTYCQQRRLHTRSAQSLFVIRHYLGSFAQYTDREQDARRQSAVVGGSDEQGKKQQQQQQQVEQHQQQQLQLNRTREEYQKLHNLKHVAVDRPEMGESLAPWLTGFLSHNSDSIHLLQGAGKLEAKSWRTHEGDSNVDRCALLFFGLPRSFRSLVLPSIKRNLLMPNARHNCDVYVHYYQQSEEVAGRRNRGGTIEASDVQLLDEAVKEVAAQYGPKSGRSAVPEVTSVDTRGRPVTSMMTRMPVVAFVHDTPEQYWERRGDLVRKYQDTIDPYDGKPMYFPWKSQTYTNSSLDNIVRQWHSISTAFQLMDMTAKQLNVTYSRVGMFRSDTMYLTPIDIAALDGRGGGGRDGDTGIVPHVDTRNHYFVLPPFAMYPINDRSIYGPYEAVKIWATRRFELVEQRAKRRRQPGFTMHSERFLNDMILPAMERPGYERHVNPDTCFLRTRADESVIVSDCTTDGSTRNWSTAKSMKMVGSIVGKKCKPFTIGRKFKFLGCGEGQDYKSEQYAL